MCHYYLKTRNCPYEKVCICIYMALGGFASSYFSLFCPFALVGCFYIATNKLTSEFYMIKLLGWLHVFSRGGKCKRGGKGRT